MIVSALTRHRTISPRIVISISRNNWQAITPTLLFALTVAAQTPVLMSRYDLNSTGSNPHETILNVSNVNPVSFGKLYSYYVDGAVYAQPLYVPSLAIPGRGRHNVLFVATMNDKVYAFDADRNGPPLWMRDFTDERKGITPVPVTDITNDNNLNIVGNAGIEGTPVIDLAASAIFLVVRTKENGAYVQTLHKLRLADGADAVPAAVIEASVPSSSPDAKDGMLRFDPEAGNQRTALVLVSGNVIIAWASHEDIQPYHGWVMAYDAKTLKQTAALCTAPDGPEAGIWQSGRAPAVDSAGAIYFEVGNGHYDGKRDFGTSILKLSIRNRAFSMDDYFTPHDYDAMNDRDVDLGSTGPLLIPGSDMLVAGSKKGTVYLLDKNKLGRLTANDAGILQAVEVNGGRILAGPAYWNGILYTWSEADFLKAFRFDGHALAPTPFAKGTVGSRGSPGGAISVSSDGNKPGTGIVWGTISNGRSADHGNAPGLLCAFHAETLEPLWDSEQFPERGRGRQKRDRLGTLVKFVPPVVAAGKVYVPNYDNAVVVYGLLQRDPK